MPLLTHIRTRVVHRTRLVLSFHLAVKAKVRLLALRRKKVVARTPMRTLGAGNRQLVLQLDPKHWPAAAQTADSRARAAADADDGLAERQRRLDVVRRARAAALHGAGLLSSGIRVPIRRRGLILCCLVFLAAVAAVTAFALFGRGVPRAAGLTGAPELVAQTDGSAPVSSITLFGASPRGGSRRGLGARPCGRRRQACPLLAGGRLDARSAATGCRRRTARRVLAGHAGSLPREDARARSRRR